MHTNYQERPSSGHRYLCKKDTFYNQAFRLNKICSGTSSFVKKFNDLEAWFINRVE